MITLRSVCSFGMLAFAGLALAGGCAVEAEKARTPRVTPPQTEDCQFTASEGRLPEAPQQTTAPEILGVGCRDNRLEVVFSSFKDGNPLALKPGDVSVALAKLEPNSELPAMGRWVSYLNRLEIPTIGDWPGTKALLQATTENTGVLTKLSEGVYAYAFTTDVAAVTAPVKVAFDPKLTHRVGIEFRGDVLDPALGNPVYTWTPAATEPTKVSLTRNIVDTASCTSCHGRLEAHGGARTDTQYCVLCHNPGTSDANSGASMDFPVLVHKIHMGAKLPSVVAGGSYTVWGHRDTKHDFSNVHYPQDQRNCAKCHSGSNPATPDGDAWMTQPTIAACTACHDNLDITSAATTHAGGQQTDDKSCVTCHGAGKKSATELKHRTLFATPHNPNVPEGVPVVTYELKDVVMAGDPATMPTATFTIKINGAPYDIKTTPRKYEGNSVSGLPSLLVAFSMPESGATVSALDAWNDPELDYNNRHEGTVPANLRYAQPGSFTLTALSAGLIANADGSYTTKPFQLGSVPSNAQNITVVLQGYLSIDIDGSGSAGSDERFGGASLVAAVGKNESPRREIVEIGKCNACHERLSLHGGNRVDSIGTCVTCHNPNATDGNRRTAGFIPFVDGLPERTVAFAPLVHAIHAGASLQASTNAWYGFNGPIDFKEVHFPNKLENCESCHKPGTYGLPVSPKALAVSIETGANKTSPWDDLNISPAGAACTACHDKPEAIAHAQAARFLATTALHGTEGDSCALCHGKGAGYDVFQVHKVK